MPVHVVTKTVAYTISRSAKNSNWLNLNATNQSDDLYAPLGEWDKH